MFMYSFLSLSLLYLVCFVVVRTQGDTCLLNGIVSFSLSREESPGNL